MLLGVAAIPELLTALEAFAAFVGIKKFIDAHNETDNSVFGVPSVGGLPSGSTGAVTGSDSGAGSVTGFNTGAGVLPINLPTTGEDTSVSSDTLIDVLKSNANGLQFQLSRINDTLALVNDNLFKVYNRFDSHSRMMSGYFYFLGLAFANYISVFVEQLSGLSSSVDNSSIVEVLDKLNSGSLSSVANAIDKLGFLNKDTALSISSVSNVISSLVGSVTSISDKMSVLNDYMSIISSAKSLEKEHYEYMKTPKTYTLSDEALPNLAPRDVIALSEAVKAHLNSQEASLTVDDLGLEEYDNAFDVENILQLFKFEGISKDLDEMSKFLNGKD